MKILYFEKVNEQVLNLFSFSLEFHLVDGDLSKHPQGFYDRFITPVLLKKGDKFLLWTIDLLEEICERSICGGGIVGGNKVQ